MTEAPNSRRRPRLLDGIEQEKERHRLERQISNERASANMGMFVSLVIFLLASIATGVAAGFFLGAAAASIFAAGLLWLIYIASRRVITDHNKKVVRLEGELAEGVWALTPADGKVLFDTPAKDLWTYLRPPAIPQPSLN